VPKGRVCSPAPEGSLLLDLFRAGAREAPPEARILEGVRAGGARFQRIHLTSNRKVMASVAEGGAALRVHEAFAEAPPAVLRSLGCIFSTRPARERAAARAEIRAFLTSTVPITPAPRRRPNRPRAADRPLLERLATEFAEVNAAYFEGRLPKVTIRLSGRMRRRNGHFDGDALEIAISRRLCEQGAAGEAERTLRHEMIHLCQFLEGRKPGHGSDFRRWARRLGIHPRATRSVDWMCAGP
jgi:hypothetical protein